MERRGAPSTGVPNSKGPASASRLLAATPASGEIPVAPRHPNAALAETVVEWMPIAGDTPHAPHGHLWSLPPLAPRDESPLGSVGLHEGDMVGSYRVESSLGHGGMGVVALAHDERLERHVAIKFIKADLFAFPEMRTFFNEEARAMARVSHRNVLSVFTFGEHQGTPYFVMEYVEGMTVEQWLRMREPGAFPALDQSVRILDQACLGVEAIHATSTVHRDLKPSNLLIDKAFRVAVGDLGVARVLESSSQGNFIVGSASYMAPEAALGEDEAPQLAQRRDIYALGCIAYELLTGRPPFVGETDMNILSQHVLQEPAPPSALRPDLPRGYDTIIAKALAKDPMKRYATVGELRAALLAEHSGAREPERILVADDDEDWRTLICASLAERFPNARIDQVGDGERALEAFEKHPDSVVRCDPSIDRRRRVSFAPSIFGI